MIQSDIRTCSGKLVVSVILPKAINNDIISKLKQNGFICKERFLKSGLLVLDNGDITINGTLSNRAVSIYCNSKHSEEHCKELANKTIELIKSL